MSPEAPLLRKTYRALTSLPVPLGRIDHFMFDGPFGDDEDAWHYSGGLLSSLSLPSSSIRSSPADHPLPLSVPEATSSPVSNVPICPPRTSHSAKAEADSFPSSPSSLSCPSENVLSGFARLLPRGPRLLSNHAHSGWKRCSLVVRWIVEV